MDSSYIVGPTYMAGGGGMGQQSAGEDHYPDVGETPEIRSIVRGLDDVMKRSLGTDKIVLDVYTVGLLLKALRSRGQCQECGHDPEAPDSFESEPVCWKCGKDCISCREGGDVRITAL